MQKWIVFALVWRLFSPEAVFADRGTCAALLQPIPLWAQETDFTCGAACARSLLQYFRGRIYPEGALAEEMGTYALGYTQPVRLEARFSQAGLKTALAENLTMKDLIRYLRRGESMIVFITLEETPHYAILSGITATDVTLMDPWIARDGVYSTMPLKEFEKMWTFTLDGETSRGAVLRVWP